MAGSYPYSVCVPDFYRHVGVAKRRGLAVPRELLQVDVG